MPIYKGLNIDMYLKSFLNQHKQLLFLCGRALMLRCGLAIRHAGASRSQASASSFSISLCSSSKFGAPT